MTLAMPNLVPGCVLLFVLAAWGTRECRVE